jgi:predicted metalloprotease
VRHRERRDRPVLAQEYVVAHEVQAGAGEGSVRTELMADCLGGMWARGAATTLDSSGTTLLEPLTEQDIADALSAAAAVGDDRIQQAATGQVDPDSWTHGSSTQRDAAFRLGYQTGRYDQGARILTEQL